MSDHIMSSTIQTFADDTKISHPILTTDDEENLQKDLNHLYNWSKENKMALNDDKYELICHRHKMNPSLKRLRELPFFKETVHYVSSKDSEVYPTNAVKDLGIIIDPIFTYEPHISKITVDARRMSGWILNVFRTRDVHPMMLLFNSLVRSRLEYCCILWDPYSIRHINKIEQAQRSFTSKISGAQDLNYWERLQHFNLLSLQRRREQQALIHTWKLLNGLVRNDIDLEFKTCERTSRIKAILKPMPKIKGKLLSVYENSFIIRSAKLWNLLPAKLTREANKHAFCNNLNKWLAEIPDRPPISGYYHVNRNSLLDHDYIFG